MKRLNRLFLLAATALLTAVACQKEVLPEDIVIPDKPEPVKPVPEKYTGVIPQNIQGLPRVYITTPSGRGVQGIDEKRNKSAGINEWTILCTIDIRVTTASGKDSSVYWADSLKIRGRGNSTWAYFYRKRPYNLKLKHKVDLYGTGKTKRWVLLSNWMDRTLLRNDVAFEAARRSAMEWAPSGSFVELYVDGDHRYNYWLGEKIHVEGSNFLADYLYCYDNSDKNSTAFTTLYGGKNDAGLPIEFKYPDLDDYPEALTPGKEALYAMENLIYTGDWGSKVDANSFCDWFLVHELCGNAEPKHPKSSYFYIRDGIFYAGPVWDFDWGTFTPDSHQGKLLNTYSIYFEQLLKAPAFREKMKQRWKVLKPRFETLDQYIDERADLIRESEAANHEAFPCYPNPMSEDHSGMINFDEQLTFQEAVDRMKEGLRQRIQELDTLINQL